MLNTYINTFAHNLFSATARANFPEQLKAAETADEAKHCLAVNSLLANTVNIFQTYKSEEYSAHLLRQSKQRVSQLRQNKRTSKIGFAKTDDYAMATGSNKREVKYQRVFREYMRTVEGREYTVKLPTLVQNWEDWEPTDWKGDIQAVTKPEREEQRKHVLANAKYANRTLKRTTIETFDARHSAAVSAWLDGNKNKDEIVELLQSPLYHPDPNMVSNISDPIWQSAESSDSGPDTRGLAPRPKITDWKRFAIVMNYAGFYKGRHWSRIGTAQDGDATWIVRPALFREHARRAQLRRTIAPSKLAEAETALRKKWPHWRKADTDHVVRLAGLLVSWGATSDLRPLERAPSDRVARARERMRAKRAARKSKT